MNVKELKEAIKDLPEDLEVWVEDDECGERPAKRAEVNTSFGVKVIDYLLISISGS